MLVRKAEECRLHPIGEDDHQDSGPSIEVSHLPELLGDEYADVDEGKEPVQEAPEHTAQAIDGCILD